MRFRDAPRAELALVFVFACGGGGGAPSSPDAGGPDGGAPDAARTCPEPPPPPEACDLFLGCGCDTMGGEKCTLLSSGHRCFPAGAAGPWEPCVGEADCAAGTMCVGYAGTNLCMAFCDDAHACPDQEACYVRITDGMDPPTILGEVCGQVCSLLLQDCRFDPQGCFTSSEVPEAEHGICANAGTGSQGATCQRANDCAEGYLCVTPPSGMSICSKICDLVDGDPACDQGSCQPLTGHVQTGVCLTP